MNKNKWNEILVFKGETDNKISYNLVKLINEHNHFFLNKFFPFLKIFFCFVLFCLIAWDRIPLKFKLLSFLHLLGKAHWQPQLKGILLVIRGLV